MRKRLCTFFLDYRGGTYVSQARASSPLAALKAWADGLDYTEVEGLGRSAKTKLKQGIGQPPTQVEGIKNTWCHSSVLRGHLALIHITQTEE
jgi:hypothetical protein